MPSIVVDCDSHVFNAEEMPHRRVSQAEAPAPSSLTGASLVPLDFVAAGCAPAPRRRPGCSCSSLSGSTGSRPMAGWRESEKVSRQTSSPERRLHARPAQVPLGRASRVTGRSAEEKAASSPSGDQRTRIAALLAEALPEQLAEIDEWLGSAGTGGRPGGHLRRHPPAGGRAQGDGSSFCVRVELSTSCGTESWRGSRRRNRRYACSCRLVDFIAAAGISRPRGLCTSRSSWTPWSPKLSGRRGGDPRP